MTNFLGKSLCLKQCLFCCGKMTSLLWEKGSFGFLIPLGQVCTIECCSSTTTASNKNKWFYFISLFVFKNNQNTTSVDNCDKTFFSWFEVVIKSSSSSIESKPRSMLSPNPNFFFSCCLWYATASDLDIPTLYQKES